MGQSARASSRSVSHTVCFLVACVSLLSGTSVADDHRLGIFEGTADVGTVGHSGAAEFVPADDRYVITGSGANVWGEKDAFRFLWRRLAGDAVLTAQVHWQGEGKNPHRKAGWMLRRGLDAGAPYVDAAVHGDGLICLQYRQTQDGPTREVQSPVRAPALVRLERHDDVFTLSLSQGRGPFQPVGSVVVPLGDPLYAGLFVCSHDDSTVETALLSEVRFNAPGQAKAEERVLESTLEIIDVETGRRRIVHRERRHFEAPNWSPDGAHLLFNSGGRLYTIPVSGGDPRELDTAAANRCNNDHGYSPDGRWLAISHHHEGASRIFILPSGGGVPRLITPLGPSYWHGWSPDGKTLAYCAERSGEFDVYTIPVAGGAERRLTHAQGLDDGPEYAPDGEYIYFNSERTGLMKLWRMRADGSAQEQVTFDAEYADWFPHVSPDGKLVVFLSYDKAVQGHPAHQPVLLRMLSRPDGKPRVLACLFGGQGTINVPSWSPDNRSVAFVSYRLVIP